MLKKSLNVQKRPSFFFSNKLYKYFIFSLRTHALLSVLHEYLLFSGMPFLLTRFSLNCSVSVNLWSEYFFPFFQRRTQNHPWAEGSRMVLCPSGFINFALPKNLCTYQDIPFKHPIRGGQLPKNVCKIL